VELFAGFEAHGFAGSNGNFGSSAGVPADSSLSGANIEDAKASQLDPLAIGESFFEALEDGVHSGLGLDAGQAGPFDNVVDDVLFNQCLSPHDESFPANYPALE
jgi:hypothetical protein